MRQPIRNPSTRHVRGGFTLIEMLVATALVLLIMLLFASIYGAAVGTITEQRGLANNDSKGRTIDAIIRRDLEQMTFRQLSTEGTRGLVPLASGDVVDPRQQGFFYLSENDPDDPTDDVLHYTIDVTQKHRNDDSTPLFGRATDLAAISGAGSVNQPDYDDGVGGNATGQSAKAEVSLFMRGGKLYRRVQLIRDALGAPLNTLDYPAQPSDNDTQRTELWKTSNPNYGNASGTTSILNDFDYSLTRIDTDFDNDPSTWDTYLRMLGPESLNNATGLSNYPLAIPRYRFGFAPINANNLLGRPVEFDHTLPIANAQFLGRLTQAETSHVDFLYPGQAALPWTVVPDPLFVLNSNFIVAKYDGASSTGQPGARQSADLLLNNVSQFDVEVWDSGYAETDVDNADMDKNTSTGYEDFNGNGVQDSGAWLDLGHNEGGVLGMVNYPLGHYGVSQNNIPAYGPRLSPDTQPTGPADPSGPNLNRVFDTWHPQIGSLPPYRPYRYATPGVNWGSSSAATVGMLIYPDYSNDMDSSNDNFAFVYRCVSVGSAGGFTGTKTPEWPRQHGAIVRERAGTVNEVIWQCNDNRIGLEAIRITIRYQDPGSKLERQLTIYHSFVE